MSNINLIKQVYLKNKIEDTNNIIIYGEMSKVDKSKISRSSLIIFTNFFIQNKGLINIFFV